jgi:formyltetrahydrofolate deformylase
MAALTTQLAPVPADDAGPGPDIGRLTMSCPDGPGIIARVTGFLHQHGANIVQSDQHSTGPTGGRFFLRTEFHLPGLRHELAALERGFAAEVARGLGAWFRLRDASVPARVALFVSRYDHCLLDLLWRARRGELPIDVVQVISNHPDLGPEVAAFGVPFTDIPVTRDTKPQAEQRQLELLRGTVDLVVLARYMQILSAGFLDEVGVPVINIHHSFLPAFAGAGPYERARERGVKLIGATAHYATEDLDEGPIIEQDVVRVSHRDSVAELSRRGADIERTVLARAVTWHCQDRVLVNGRTAIVFLSRDSPAALALAALALAAVAAMVTASPLPGTVRPDCEVAAPTAAAGSQSRCSGGPPRPRQGGRGRADRPACPVRHTRSTAPLPPRRARPPRRLRLPGSGAVGLAPVPDGVDLDGEPVLVDAVDDPVGPASSGVVTVEGLIQWLAGAVRVAGDDPVDRRHGGRRDIERQVLVQVPTDPPGEDDRVRRGCLSAGGFRLAVHGVPRRRSSSLRTCPASKVSPAAKSSRDCRRSESVSSSLRMSSVSFMDSYSATEISMTSARPLRVMVKWSCSRATRSASSAIPTRARHGSLPCAGSVPRIAVRPAERIRKLSRISTVVVLPAPQTFFPGGGPTRPRPLTARYRPELRPRSRYLSG